MRERDTDILIEMSKDMGEVKATVLGLKDSHTKLHEKVEQNSADISTIKEEVAVAKGSKKAAKWVIATFIALAGVFGWHIG